MPAAETNIDHSRNHHPKNLYNGGGIVRTMSPSVVNSSGSRINHNNGNTSTEAGLRDRSKLLQLAERTSTRKITASPNHHLLSFRNSPRKAHSTSEVNNSFLRRNNSSSIISSESPTQTQTPRQNPKLYTSFSSKSSSKLTKAFIRSDPCSTNIEHLVSPVNKKVSPSSVETNKSNKSDHCENTRGLSNFITPLKALHASFHDKTKLANAFAPRNRLFSQREKSASNARLISPPLYTRTESNIDILGNNHNSYSISDIPLPSPSSSEVSSDTPDNDYLEYYGNGMSNNKSKKEIRKTSTTPDILEDCMEIEFDQESGYITLESRRKRNPINQCESVSCTVLDYGSKSSTLQDPITSTSNVIKKDTEGLVNESDYCKMMSTATPMRLSSSSACRAQIITLMTRGNGSGTNNNNSGDDDCEVGGGDDNETTRSFSNDSKRVSAGVNLKERLSLLRIEEGKQNNLPRKNHFVKNNQPQIGDHHPSFSGSCAWMHSKPCDKIEQDIGSKSNMGMISSTTNVQHQTTEEIDSVTDYKTDEKRQYLINDSSSVGTGLLAKKNCGSRSVHLHHNNNDVDATSGNDAKIRTSSSLYKIINGIGSNENGDYVIENNFPISSSSQPQHKPIIHGGRSRPSARKLSSRSARLKSKCKPLMHSLSFRNYGEKSSDGCGYSNMKNDDSFDRNRSKSLPKSFMSVSRYGLKSVLPSLWTRDELLFQRLEERKNSSPESSQTDSSELETTSKMRWQKSATSTSNSGADGRPKSFDYSQRKAWMRYYRDMEVSSATNSSPLVKGTKAISKGSISHLHLLVDSQEDILGSREDEQHPVQGHPNPSEIGIARRTTPDPLGLAPSLFQRFSKTFSLRFGSNSNVNKASGNGRKIKGPLGSSPDLLVDRLEQNGNGGKMRKDKSKSIRGEKCQSGDSGIGMDDHPPVTNRLRRIRSEVLETVSSRSSSSSDSRISSGGSTKMSLVEIPNHVWDEASRSRKNIGDTNNLTMMSPFEDILDSKLDKGKDDGFSSGEENITKSNGSNRVENPSYYHSLPSKNTRKKKQIQIESQLVKTPERTKSLEDSQQPNQNQPQEDNSIRGKVIKEIVYTEQNYVKTLNDIVQGFLNPCRARRDLFSSETVRNIFSNIEDVLRLHAKFLEAIKQHLNPNCISASNVGQIFTEWADHFDLYSEYCCNNPISMATVRSLIQVQEYAEFFEACRRLQLMDKLPLHGFLLRPIQRICQYHLQLNELLKQTEATHEDYPAVVEAVETMKSVAMKVNDTQRQFDSLQEIIRAQNSIDGWEGADLLNRNSLVLLKGDLMKAAISKRHKDTYVFLLNKDLVYCKKDFIRKGGYVYDGRIDLEVGVWLNIDSNYEDEFFGMVHNSWRVYSPELKTWILFTAPSSAEKRKWITALERTSEVYPMNRKMGEMAKLITVLSQENSSPGHSYPSNCNTLPKSNKKSKGKHSSSNASAKVDADTMLIEVSKLKRPAYVNQQGSSHKERSSKFYV